MLQYFDSYASDSSSENLILEFHSGWMYLYYMVFFIGNYSQMPHLSEVQLLEREQRTAHETHEPEAHDRPRLRGGQLIQVCTQ